MWLIGMMGSGKSEVGARAAKQLGVEFHDTDSLVEASAGRSVAEIFDDLGESGFRDLEAAAVAMVPDGGVAAAGGGAVLTADNRQVIARSPVVVWLRCEVGELARRVSDGDRPLLAAAVDTEDTLRRLLSERAPLYASLSTHDLDTTSRGLDEVVSEVVTLWPV